MIIDLTGDTKDTVDRTMPNPGWYKATVIDSLPDEDADAQIVRYRVTAPTFIGSVIDDKIFNPEGSKDDAAGEISLRRLKLMLKRLGLIGDSDYGKQVEIDWLKAKGRDVVLHLTEREGKGEMAGKKFVNIDFGGVFPLDHDKIPVAERQRMGLPLLPGQETPLFDAADGKKEPKKRGRPATGTKSASPGGDPSLPPAINVDDV